MIPIIRSAIGSAVSSGFIRFLKENGFKVIGTDIISENAGKFLVDEFVKVPEACKTKSLIEAYNKIAKKWGASWIISGPESEILTLVKNDRRLIARPFHNPIETLNICADKFKLNVFLNEHGIKTPKTQKLSAFKKQFVEDKKIVLKPISGRGGSGVYIAETSKLDNYRKIVDEKKYVVQQCIPGKEYSVDTLHDFDGNLLNIVVRERLSTISGKSVSAKTVKHQDICSIIKRLSKQMTFYGANCIQFIYDPGNKSFYLTDINPRFGGGAILSLKSSKTFRRNLVNLLKGNHDDIIDNSEEFESMKMFRGYEEFYEKV